MAIKKSDGRSKAARALRAKPGPAPKKPRAVAPRKREKVADPVELDKATQLRVLSLQIASQNVGRDTAPRDLVSLARQIENFLTGQPVAELDVTWHAAGRGLPPEMSAGERAEQAA